MLNNRMGEKARKIISTILVGLTILGSVILYGNHKKIVSLEERLQLKQQVENQKTNGYTKTFIDTKTIEYEFNRLQDYSILKNNKVNINHSYNYDKESFLGLHKKGTLTATANVIYDVDVRLSNANIFIDDRGVLNIQLEKPFIDERSVHYEQNSMLINEEKSNILFNKEDGKNIMQYWINSFTTSSIDKLKEHYSSEYEQKRINDIAKKEVKQLVNTLIKDINVKVTIITD